MWIGLIFSLLLFNWGIFQPEIPNDIEKIEVNLSENEISFTFLNLEQGECTLIQSGTGENILLNTGAPEAGEELLYYLGLYGVEELSSILITSAEDDYIGNLQSLLKNIQVDHVILPEDLKGIPLTADIESWSQDEDDELLKTLKSKVLYKGSSEEHYGMDVLFEYKGTYLLYMTTANGDIEKKLIEENDLSVVNVLKVGDFGNPSGTSEAFLSECDPQVAVLFNNEKNRAIMDVLERLHETWMDIYQTRQVGNISVKIKDHDYQVFTITLDTFRSLS
jgi:beta-lactamase superfamily II metal-dependent hydrolase